MTLTAKSFLSEDFDIIQDYFKQAEKKIKRQNKINRKLADKRD